MNTRARSIITQGTNNIFFSRRYISSVPYSGRCENRGIRLLRAMSLSSKSERSAVTDKSEEMDTGTGDVMYQSFGDGYATRCEDEGFGVIYTGNQSVKDHDNDIRENGVASPIKGSRINDEKSPTKA